MYRISYIGRVTSPDPGSSSLQLQITYTDPVGSTAVTWPAADLTNINFTNLNTNQATISGSFCVFAKASTDIKYIITYLSGTPNTMIYNLHIRVEAI